MLKRIAIIIVAYAAAIAALSFVEQGLWRALLLPDLEKFRASDLHHIFRQAGNLLAWAMIAAAIWMARRGRRSGSVAAPAWLIVASPLLAGAMAELLKRLIGRERPGTSIDTGAYTFKPFLKAFSDDSNLGLPSSHAAVAFGGAFMLMKLFPGAGWVALVWAVGCGMTRIALGAHYISDVVAGVGLGHLAATLFSRFATQRADAHIVPSS